MELDLDVRVVLLIVLLGYSLCQEDTSTTLTETYKTNLETEELFETSKTNLETEELLETSKTNLETEELLETYKTNLETAISMERSEKKRTKNITDEFNLNLVLKMTEYRLQMIFHRNHSLRQDENEKWLQCVSKKSDQIKEMEEAYATEETQCVSDSHAGITDRKKTLKQIIKEIRDWKKGYKYLQNLCKKRYVLSKDYGECLVDYMQRDSYSTTLHRLLELLDVSLTELKRQAEGGLSDFEDCLRRTLSKFLGALRKLKGLLNKCYSKRNIVLERRAESTVIGCDFFTKLKNCASLN